MADGVERRVVVPRVVVPPALHPELAAFLASLRRSVRQGQRLRREVAALLGALAPEAAKLLVEVRGRLTAEAMAAAADGEVVQQLDRLVRIGDRLARMALALGKTVEADARLHHALAGRPTGEEPLAHKSDAELEEIVAAWRAAKSRRAAPAAAVTVGEGGGSDA